MKKHWHWNERTRLVVTLELAVVLPAAALIIFSALRLKSIQRDRNVEAAIQRDFYQVLAISEKHMSKKADEMVEQVRLSCRLLTRYVQSHSTLCWSDTLTPLTCSSTTPTTE